MIFKKSISFFICLALALSFFAPPNIRAASESVTDLAGNSERFLSDFAVGSGGETFVDALGNVVFRIKKTGHSLKFKCTGDSPMGEQNAICIWLNNLTGSSRMYVDIVFMRLDGEQYSVNYEKVVENSGSDVFLFVPSVPDEFVVSISLRVAGVGEGRFSVRGIWHCFYSFAESSNTPGIGMLSRLSFGNGGDTVLIEGTVLHDVTVASRDSRINVYRLLPGDVLSDEFIAEREPCASSSMSRSFAFAVKNRTGEDYASAYAVTVNRPDGSIEYVIEDKLYPSVEYKKSKVYDFKGVASMLEYTPNEMSSESLIVDIDIKDFAGGALRGYLYSFGGKNYCFDNETVDSIARRIESHTADGGEVYLRLVGGLEGSAPNAVYDADGEKAAALYAAISFLCEHYEKSVNGVVMGNSFDTPYSYPDTRDADYTEYVRKYSDAVSIALMAGRNVDSSFKVVVPVSANNVASDEDGFGSDKYPMFAMLISFLEVYSLSSEGEITMMVCDSTFPYVGDILGGESREMHDPLKKNEIMNLRAENIAIFEDFLDYLTLKYKVTDESYFYSWHPFGIHSQTELSAAYMYNYFLLRSSERVYSFFCDFVPDERLGNFTKSADMLEAVRIMGGEDAFDFADSFFLKNFSATLEGIEGYDGYVSRGITVKQLGTLISTPVGLRGSYSLTDFGDPSGLINWKKGVYAESISTYSLRGEGRSLRAALTLPANVSEFAEIIYHVGKSADMSKVNAIGFSLRISGDDMPDETEFTVKLSIGSETAKGVVHYTEKITAGEPFTIIADTSRFSGMDGISYIKISVQNNSGIPNKTFLHVGEIRLYSQSATDAELAEIFASDGEGGDGNDGRIANTDMNTRIFVFAGISLLSMLVVYVVMRNRNDEAD